jgi:hypothetical protein
MYEPIVGFREGIKTYTQLNAKGFDSKLQEYLGRE